MMSHMNLPGQFDEVDTTEAEFDAMMAESEPVGIEPLPSFEAMRLAATGLPYVLTTSVGSHQTSGSWGPSTDWARSVTAGVLSPA